MWAMAAGVDPTKGREAADIIEAARLRMDPLPKVAELARSARVDNYAWAQIIKKGRGLPQTFLKMAAVTGVEPQVREALGLPPLADAGDLSPFERSIMASGIPDEKKRAAIEIFRGPGGPELMESVAQEWRERRLIRRA
jgi:hypothetical protein